MAKTFGDFLQISPVPTDFLVGYRGSTEARTTVDSLCTSLGIGDFISNVTVTKQNSASWSSAYTTLNANSALYGQEGSTYTTVNAGSANWNSTYTSLQTASGGYDAATALVNTYNSRWILQSGNTFGTPTPVVIGNLTNEGLSLITNGTSRLDIANTGGIQINGGSNATMVTTKILTADFTNPEEFVSRRYVDSLAFQTAVSGNFVPGLYYTKTQTSDLVASAVAPGNSVYSSVKSNSANWQSTYTTVSANSANWADTRNDVIFTKSLSATATSGWIYLGGSVAQGFRTTAPGLRSHAEGGYSTASGTYSHAEGDTTTAAGANSHAEGQYTYATGIGSHAEGLGSVASGGASHAEGYQNTAAGSYSHAQNYQNTAAGSYSHAEGINNTARGMASHAAGSYTDAVHDRTWVWQGSTATSAVSTTRTDQFLVSAAGGIYFPGNVGIGTDNNINALTVAGNISGSGSVGVVSISSRFLDLIHLPANDGTNPVLRIGEYDTTTAGNAGFSGMFMSYNEITNIFGISAQFAPTAGIPAISIDRGGRVGIGTDVPTENLTVAGNINASGTTIAANISAANIVYALGGNSNQWNSNWTVTNSNSANWSAAYTNLVSNSANYLSGASISYVNANFLPLSGGGLTGLLTSTDGISATSLSARFLDLIHLPANDGTNPVIRIGEIDNTTGNAGFSGMYISYNETTNTFGISAQFAPAAGVPAVSIDRNGNIGAGNAAPAPNTAIAVPGGNSNQWNSVYTNVNTNSAFYGFIAAMIYS